MHTNAPMTFTRTTRSNQSRGSAASEVRGISFISAALLTRMSTPPNRPTACSAIDRAASGSVMSTCTPIAWCPSAASLAAACSACSASRSASTTAAPGLGERPAVHLADPAGATRHDGDLALQ